MADTRLVYDDDCGFCTWWAEFLATRSDLQLVGFSDVSADVRDRLPDDWQECSHLVTDDRVYSCGASIEEALARSTYAPVVRPLVSQLRRLGSYGTVREWGYRQVADHRTAFGRLMSRRPPAQTTDPPTPGASHPAEEDSGGSDDDSAKAG